jgi:hypothetical protein
VKHVGPRVEREAALGLVAASVLGRLDRRPGPRLDYETTSQTYDPDTDRWGAPVDMPIEASECYPTSTLVRDVVFAWFCGAAALSADGGTGWERLEGGPLEETVHSDAYGRDLVIWRFASLVSADTVIVMPMQGLTLNHRGVACYGCDKSPEAYRVYRPPATVVPDTSPVGKHDAERVVQTFLYAWQFGVDGMLPWFVTQDALDRFESEVPHSWTRSTYRLGRITTSGGGSFSAEVDLIVRDGPTRAVRLWVEVGAATPIGGDPVALAVVDVKRR